MYRSRSEARMYLAFFFIAMAASILASCYYAVRKRAYLDQGGEREASLTGRFTCRDNPVAEGIVFLSRQYPPAEGENVFEAETDGDGYFRFFVPAGRYFIYGRKEGNNGLFAFSGQNPIDVAGTGRFVGLKGVLLTTPTYEESGDDDGGIRGRVVFAGEPVPGAYTYLYSDDSSLYKGLGFALSSPTDEEGVFYLENLPETDYVVVARKRTGGGMTGPLGAGDLYCFYPGNPLFVTEGRVAVIEIECVAKEKDISYAEITSGSRISLKGYVVDRFGSPVENVYAFVYDTRVFGHKRPYSHSGKTGTNGRFTINIDKPGTYYLGSREVFGKTPRPGELFGFYGGTPDHSIRVTSGEQIDDLVIVVDRILEGDTKEGGVPRVQERVFDRGMVVESITRDRTIEGELSVEGIVVVPKGVTVTILPGTRITFKKIDIDGDGIGDGEFYVEGNILVRGTPDNPVIFTSAEADPGPKDWKYLFVNLSSRAEFEYMISEYAFSGLQIHFSNAVVKNCIFRNNVDGLRFSTVRGTFEENLMRNNTYGVRYEERATNARLSRNLITENRVGIFSVLESKGGLVIDSNNVEKNDRYNFKLGNRQKQDLPASGNWWGSAEEKRVEESIFDGFDVPGLGKVLFRPFSKAPHDAGPGGGMISPRGDLR